MKIDIRVIEEADRPWVKKYIKGHWGSALIIIHGEQYRGDEMSGFIAYDENNNKVGMVTYEIKRGDCQIITINSDSVHNGVGTALLNSVKNVAIDHFCKRLWLITTNDNVDALLFYQKYGFIIDAIRMNEIIKSRKLKPQIPEKGKYEIPIRDEFELSYYFKKN